LTPSTSAQPISPATPQIVTADPQGIQAAKAANLVRQNPTPAPPGDVDRLLNRSNHNVLQWNPEWISYDSFSRPVIFNPFGQPLHMIWQIAGEILQLVIPAFGRVVTEIPKPGLHSVTMMLPNDSGEPDQVSAAVLGGGGGDPGPGPRPPPRPLAPAESNDVCVVVNYTHEHYTSRSLSARSSMSATTRSTAGTRCFSTV
jgi:hypothetical protein